MRPPYPWGAPAAWFDETLHVNLKGQAQACSGLGLGIQVSAFRHRDGLRTVNQYDIKISDVSRLSSHFSQVSRDCDYHI